MEVVIWMILGFRSQKCKQFFSGTQLSNLGPQTPIFTNVLCITACSACGIAQRCSWLTHFIIGEAALAADLITASNLCPLEAALAADLEPFAFFLSFAGSSQLQVQAVDLQAFRMRFSSTKVHFSECDCAGAHILDFPLE